MKTKVYVNLGLWVAMHLSSVIAGKRPLIMGSLITYLALQLKLVDLSDHALSGEVKARPLDTLALCTMGMAICTDEKVELVAPGKPAPRQIALPYLQDRSFSGSSTYHLGDTIPQRMVAMESTLAELCTKVDALTTMMRAIGRVTGADFDSSPSPIL